MYSYIAQLFAPTFCVFLDIVEFHGIKVSAISIFQSFGYLALISFSVEGRWKRGERQGKDAGFSRGRNFSKADTVAFLREADAEMTLSDPNGPFSSEGNSATRMGDSPR